MKRLLIIALALLLARPALATDPVLCQQPGSRTPTQCPQPLSTGNLPVVPKTKGGFGQDVSAGLTNGYYAKVVGGALTFAAILAGDLPTGIDVAKLAAGTVSNTVFGYIANLRSDVQAQIDLLQPLDADLTAIAALTGTGILARTASNSWSVRTMQQPAAGLTITNPAGVSGDPTFALANDLGALESLSSTGIACRTGTDTWAQRSISAGSGISVTNGDGVSGNPTVAVASTAVSAGSYPTSGQIPTFTVGADGRLTAAGSTTTLTSPAISSPALTGTSTGAGLIAKANGGFGQSVATGLTYGQIPYVDSSGVLQLGNQPQPLELFLDVGNAAVGTTTVTLYPAPNHAVVQTVGAAYVPTIVANAAGSISGLTLQIDGGNVTYASSVGASDSLTIKVQRSTNHGTSWSDLSGSAVQCTATAGTSTCSDTTHTGTFSAGDWIAVSAVTTLITFAYQGSVRVRLRYN